MVAPKEKSGYQEKANGTQCPEQQIILEDFVAINRLDFEFWRYFSLDRSSGIN